MNYNEMQDAILRIIFCTNVKLPTTIAPIIQFKSVKIVFKSYIATSDITKEIFFWNLVSPSIYSWNQFFSNIFFGLTWNLKEKKTVSFQMNCLNSNKLVYASSQITRANHFFLIMFSSSFSLFYHYKRFLRKCQSQGSIYEIVIEYSLFVLTYFLYFMFLTQVEPTHNVDGSKKDIHKKKIGNFSKSISGIVISTAKNPCAEIYYSSKCLCEWLCQVILFMRQTGVGGIVLVLLAIFRVSTLENSMCKCCHLNSLVHSNSIYKKKATDHISCSTTTTNECSYEN